MMILQPLIYLLSPFAFFFQPQLDLFALLFLMHLMWQHQAKIHRPIKPVLQEDVCSSGSFIQTSTKVFNGLIGLSILIFTNNSSAKNRPSLMQHI
jgi:hypothetical protein